MMTHNYLKQLNGSYETYTKLFEQSDGKKLHRGSDDAVGYSKYLRYQNSLTNVQQFQDDITTAVSWMKNSDAALINEF
jgi:flagellar hook-associated protein 3 FlgL